MRRERRGPRLLKAFGITGWAAVVSLVIVVGLMPGMAAGVTISDTATGSATPGSAIFPATVTSGDFTYAGNAIAFNVGDGNDETVTWRFDFTGHPSYPSFPPAGPLTSALLTLTLTPQNALISTDLARIDPLANIVTPIIQSLPVGVTSTISLELLDFYASGDILGVLAANAGQIPMVYADDSIITFAQLDLVAAPEPASLLLLAAGLASSAVLRRARRS